MFKDIWELIDCLIGKTSPRDIESQEPS